MVTHEAAGYSRMWVLRAGSSAEIARLESLLISEFKHIVQNKISGGGRVSRRPDAVWFLYLCTSG